MNFINQLSKHLRKQEFIHHVKTRHAGANLADIQLISTFNKGIRFLLCVINIFSKYAWVIPLKDKKGVTIVNAFWKVLSKSDLKPNKIWIFKGSVFYNRSMKS